MHFKLTQYLRITYTVTVRCVWERTLNLLCAGPIYVQGGEDGVVDNDANSKLRGWHQKIKGRCLIAIKYLHKNI